ncbi:hypothetical protein COO91_00474 [Nostoc flagelliforme CCNUN1]|uniref:Uncharacterized protein n=1 Tax=Nostoc flagelliforme CCNUN1 TaxID=2038116 RepID=A0A2K8SIH7_9NOSO|nr:hypothetical protein COO91_00474 [Nostoc flagelliforme CCNUN1]
MGVLRSLSERWAKILLQTAIAPSYQVLAASSDRICLTNTVPLPRSKLQVLNPCSLW